MTRLPSPSLALLAASFLTIGAACSQHRPAAGGAGDRRASSSEPVPKLARLPDSLEGDAAVLVGTLKVSGRCIHANAGGEKILIASMVPGAHWDAAAGVLVAGESRLRHGSPIFLGGSSAPIANLRDRWVEPPAQECVTPRAWIAVNISAR